MNIRKALNSNGHKLILGDTGSGKSTFINLNFNNIKNKKIIITKELDILKYKSINLEIYNFNDINFNYYLKLDNFKDYINMNFDMKEEFSIIAFKIISEIKQKIKSVFFIDILNFYKNSFNELDSKSINSDELKNEIEFVLIKMAEEGNKIDLLNLLNSENDILVYISELNSHIVYYEVFLSDNLNHNINVIIDDSNFSIIDNNNIKKITNKNVKLFLVTQFISLDNINYFSEIFLFCCLQPNLLTYFRKNIHNFNNCNIKDNSFFYIDINAKTFLKFINKNKFRFFIEKRIESNFNYCFENIIFGSSGFNVTKVNDLFILKNQNFEMVLNLNNEKGNINLIKCKSLNDNKTFMYNLTITKEQYFLFIKESHYTVGKDLLKILIY